MSTTAVNSSYNISHALQRWLFSTNHKDIGTLYFLLGGFSGILGTAMSILIRLELSGTGPQVMAGNHQFYNVVITAHAILMIFFIADSNVKFQSQMTQHITYLNHHGKIFLLLHHRHTPVYPYWCIHEKSIGCIDGL